MKYSFLLIQILWISLVFSQTAQIQKVTRDTTYHLNNSVIIIQTTIAQYYNDSTCVWEVSYPIIKGLPDLNIQDQMNRMFIELSSIGDCDEDKECDTQTNYPKLNTYWNKTAIFEITQDLISFNHNEGGTVVGFDECFGNENYYNYNLKNGTEYKRQEIISLTEQNTIEFQKLMMSKLPKEIKDEEAIVTQWQVKLQGGKFCVFYDNYTLFENENLTICLEENEILPFINPLNKQIVLYIKEKN
jgi:hypothetical protein